jgi:endonuclease-3
VARAARTKTPATGTGETAESQAAERALRRRAGRIVRVLAREYDAAECALIHDSALQLLMATILSAQCTDRRVNMVTPALFRRYPTAGDFADADPDELEEMIHSTGFFRNKARSIMGAAQRIRDDFDGEVPDTMEDLLTLPGVARKTANVVLGTWFGKNEGVVVDTHVFRISHRLGLAPKKNTAHTERRLMALVPRREWTNFSHRVILHGRAVCAARTPNCRECALESMCPRNGVESQPAAAGRPGTRRSGR